jgi:hypothetical protein
MAGLYFILPTLLVVFISFLVVSGAAIALMMTGLDKDRARFQALSALTGTGFTTKEAELVMNHPVRRRIIRWLMILGHAGFVTLIVTATSTIVTSQGYTLPINVILLLIGFYVIYKIATHKGLIRKWEGFIEDRLVKLSAFEEAEVEDLLHLIEGYGLVRVIIKEKSPLVDRSLLECKLSEKEMLVLGIERSKKWIPIPKAKEQIKEGDKIIVYGPLDILRTYFSEEGRN